MSVISKDEAERLKDIFGLIDLDPSMCTPVVRWEDGLWYKAVQWKGKMVPQCMLNTFVEELDPDEVEPIYDLPLAVIDGLLQQQIKDHNFACMWQDSYDPMETSVQKTARLAAHEGFTELRELGFILKEKRPWEYNNFAASYWTAHDLFMKTFMEWRMSVDLGTPVDVPRQYTPRLSWAERQHFKLNELKSNMEDHVSELQVLIDRILANVSYGLDGIFGDVREVRDWHRDLLTIEENWADAIKAQDLDWLEDLQGVRYRAPKLSVVPRVNIVKVSGYTPAKDNHWDWDVDTIPKGLMKNLRETVTEMLIRKAVSIRIGNHEPVDSPMLWGDQEVTLERDIDLTNHVHENMRHLPKGHWLKDYMGRVGFLVAPAWHAPYTPAVVMTSVEGEDGEVTERPSEIEVRLYDCPYCGEGALCFKDTWDARHLQQSKHANSAGALKGRSGHWRCLCGWYVPDEVITVHCVTKLSKDGAYWFLDVEVWGTAFIKQLKLNRPKLASMVKVAELAMIELS